MSKEYFVNRHGKKSDIDGAVVEIEKSERSVPVLSAQSTPKAGKKLRTTPAANVKKIFIGVIVLAIIFVGTVFVLADTARRDYERQTAAMKASVTTASTSALSAQTGASDATKSIINKLQSVSSCQTRVPSIIAQNYTPAQKAQSKCLEVSKLYGSLTTTLAQMGESSLYLERQKKILAPALAAPADGAFAEIPMYTTAWQTAIKELSTLSVPSQLKPAHATLMASTNKISEAWKQLLIASNEQNVQGFIEAEATLTKAYESLRKSGDEFDKHVYALQKDVDSVVKQF